MVCNGLYCTNRIIGNVVHNQNGKEPKIIGRKEIGPYSATPSAVSRHHIEITFSPETDSFVMKNLSKSKNSTKFENEALETDRQITLMNNSVISILEVRINFNLVYKSQISNVGSPGIPVSTDSKTTTTNTSNTSKETRSSTPTNEQSLQQVLLQSKQTVNPADLERQRTEFENERELQLALNASKKSAGPYSDSSHSSSSGM